MLWDPAFVALNGCGVLSLGVAGALHAILSIWGADTENKQRDDLG